VAVASVVVLLAGLTVYGVHWVGLTLSTRTQLSVPQATFALLATLLGGAAVVLLAMGVNSLASIKRTSGIVAANFIVGLNDEEEDEDEDDDPDPGYAVARPAPASSSRTYSPRCACGSGKLYKNCCGKKRRRKSLR